MAGETAAAKKRAARPRDAATLILTRGAGAGAALLMGRRHEGHRFMPGQWVFPGGRVDRGDAYIRPASPLRPEIARRLAIGCSARRADAVALASIRETFEETGLRVGRRVAGDLPRAPSAAWAAFLETGIVPALDMLDYVARAITPPYRPMRFHARFFMADAAHALGEAMPSAELVELKWVPIEEARAGSICRASPPLCSMRSPPVSAPPIRTGRRPSIATGTANRWWRTTDRRCPCSYPLPPA
jgi:8-oxo-dGTP pyrophosphatase MutT (NUDIX family)